MAKYYDSKELQVKLKSITTRLPAELDRELNASAERIKTNAQLNAPVKTGFLRANIVKRKLSNGYIVRAEADYSRIQEQKRNFLGNAIDAEMATINNIPKTILRTIGVG